MDKLIIQGGHPLQGTVAISGAKNAVLPAMAASILASGEHAIRNVPKLWDVKTMQKLLAHLGVESQLEESTLKLFTNSLRSCEAPYELVKTMRASCLVLGPLLSRWGKARVSLPGGCAIGARPIDLHLKALRKMGSQIEIREGYVEARCRKLQGAHIVFDLVTVTGTENILMAASLAHGETILENAAREPEVAYLASVLNEMGAKIEGAGTDRIVIQGVDELRPVVQTVPPDRIEAGTYLMAGAITGGEITVQGCPTHFLEVLLERLAECSCLVGQSDSGIHLQGPGRLESIDLTTAPFPGFATDLQAQFMALMTVAKGTSVITETIFENRFQHALELKRLGADITVEGPTAVVKGVPKLSGAPLMATDLRASASLILAGLRADGTTIVDRAYHIDRGYEAIESKLSTLGARITRHSNFTTPH